MNKFKTQFIGLSLFLVLSLVFSNVIAQNEGPKPLFEVAIDHEFPNPEESFKEVMTLLLNNYYTTQLQMPNTLYLY
ncbi:MAG: hypothetical protein O2887_07620 [Bacteroidetes bacterium]|nr:hypothetical protein [Bacteroidota bacterium]MDA1120349.1 hypothetical protein [Bacteroidota bacterium]